MPTSDKLKKKKFVNLLWASFHSQWRIKPKPILLWNNQAQILTEFQRTSIFFFQISLYTVFKKGTKSKEKKRNKEEKGIEKKKIKKLKEKILKAKESVGGNIKEKYIKEKKTKQGK